MNRLPLLATIFLVLTLVSGQTIIFDIYPPGDVNGTFTGSISNISYAPAPARTGDLVNISWNTVDARNSSVGLYNGIAWVNYVNSTFVTSRNITIGRHAPTSLLFYIVSCTAAGSCETANNAGNNYTLTVYSAISSVSISPSSPTTADSVSASVSLAKASDNTTIFYSLGSSWSSIANTSSASSYSFSLGTFAAGTLSYYATSCFSGICENSTTQSATVSTYSAPSTTTGSGGGGGGGGFAPAGGETHTFTTLTPDAPKDIAYSTAGITMLSVSVTDRVEGMSFTVKKETNVTGPAPTGTVYQYINISTNSPYFVKSVEITFKVDKSWLTKNNIDESTIALNHYVDGKWIALPTTKLRETTTEVVFKATSPSLSLFSVTGQSRSGFWDIINLIEGYYGGKGIDFWKIIDAVSAYYKGA